MIKNADYQGKGSSSRYYSAGRLFGRGVARTVVNALLYLFCASYIYIFIWLILNTFKNRATFSMSTFSFPTKFYLGNYLGIFKGGNFFTAFYNSAFNTVVSIVVIVILAFVVAYFLSRYTFRGRNFLYGFFLVGMLMPLLSLLIPLYIQFHNLGIVNKHYTLLFPYIAFNLPMGIYLFDSYMRTIPRSIEEAAFVDGATVNYIMVRIMFPLCLPILGTILVLDFMGIWNEFAFALVLASQPKFMTIPIWLANFQGQYGADIPGRLTAMFISMVPIILIYLFFRERMMQGMMAGAVKG